METQPGTSITGDVETTSLLRRNRDVAILSAIAGQLNRKIDVHEALQEGMLTLDEVQKAVTVDELREKFAHGDKDLEARYRDRVKYLVKAAIREEGQDFQ